MPDSHSFDDAVRLHQEGRVVEAELAYRQVLREQPDHAGALHLLGVTPTRPRLCYSDNTKAAKSSISCSVHGPPRTRCCPCRPLLKRSFSVA